MKRAGIILVACLVLAGLLAGCTGKAAAQQYLNAQGGHGAAEGADTLSMEEMKPWRDGAPLEVWGPFEEGDETSRGIRLGSSAEAVIRQYGAVECELGGLGAYVGPGPEGISLEEKWVDAGRPDTFTVTLYVWHYPAQQSLYQYRDRESIPGWGTRESYRLENYVEHRVILTVRDGSVTDVFFTSGMGG